VSFLEAYRGILNGMEKASEDLIRDKLKKMGSSYGVEE
jgi:hypothetical protein